MSRAAVLLLALALCSGCACLPMVPFAALGIAASVTTGDPSPAILLGSECVGCLYRAARR